MPNEMDWFGLMRGITELHVKSLGSRSECHSRRVLNTGDGVSGTVEGHGPTGRVTSPDKSRESDRLRSELLSELKASPADSKDIASPALASEDALAGTESGGKHPINSSPLHKFGAPSSQERSGSDQLTHASDIQESLTSPRATLVSTLGEPFRLGREKRADLNNSAVIDLGHPRGASIHSGDTIDRLMDAVAVCEERSRR